MTETIASALPANRPALPGRQDPLWAAARELEATFLAEMLKSAGLGQTPGIFGGGVGEDQFASFLRQEQAGAMVEAGGIGLAEMLYQSLLETQNDSRPASKTDR